MTTSKGLVGAQQFCSNASGFPVTAGSRHILQTNPYVLVFDDTGKPSYYNPALNRHTIAMDVMFVGGYLNFCHMGIISRHKGSNSVPYVPGDNRGGAVIAGNWGYGGGSIALEEIEIYPGAQNGDSHHPMSAQHPRGALGNPFMQENTWYRLVIESVSQAGAIGHTIRVVNKITQQTVYTLQDYWSSYSQNYVSRDAGKVVLFSIHDASKPTAGFHYKDLTSYWSSIDETVKNP